LFGSSTVNNVKIIANINNIKKKKKQKIFPSISHSEENEYRRLKKHDYSKTAMSCKKHVTHAKLFPIGKTQVT